MKKPVLLCILSLLVCEDTKKRNMVVHSLDNVISIRPFSRIVNCSQYSHLLIQCYQFRGVKMSTSNGRCDRNSFELFLFRIIPST